MTPEIRNQLLDTIRRFDTNDFASEEEMEQALDFLWRNLSSPHATDIDGWDKLAPRAGPRTSLMRSWLISPSDCRRRTLGDGRSERFRWLLREAVVAPPEALDEGL